MKVCCSCGQSKADSEFRKLAKSSDGLSYRCSDCLREYHRNWEASRPENTKRYYEKKRDSGYENDRWHTRRKFLRHGITPEMYENILRNQGGSCAICNTSSSVPLSIDHDHSCCPGRFGCVKCIRGLLCMRCNSGMGSLNDDPTVLRKAASYIEDFSKRLQDPITPSGLIGPSGI